jgi:tetratricopeptide (TPR) repeat protein
MARSNLNALVRRGLAALDDNDIRTARILFEKAARQAPTPVVLSCLGYCLAHEEHDLKKAFDLCRKALRQEPGNPLHHLNLGRVYLLAGNKPQAVKAFRKGLKFGRHHRLIDEIRRLGMRRPLIFPSLGRNHLLNRYCGFVLSRLRLRGCFHLPDKFRSHHH